jgi:cysteine-rich repeat protein
MKIEPNGLLVAVTTFLLAASFSYADNEVTPLLSQPSGLPFFTNTGNIQGPVTDYGGEIVAFTSNLSLVAVDTNGATDVFVLDRETGEIVKASTRTDGGKTNGDSSGAWLTSNGRFVVFDSQASNLSDADTDAFSDVYIHDLAVGTTTLVSQSTEGVSANGYGLYGVASEDGTKVAFVSNATNLADGDSNTSADVYLRDLSTGTTTLVSKAISGNAAGSKSRSHSMSSDGRLVAFVSSSPSIVLDDTNGSDDLFLYDGDTGALTRLSLDTANEEGSGDARVYGGVIMRTGERAVFWSRGIFANNCGTTTDNNLKLYERHIATNTTTCMDLNGRTFYDADDEGRSVVHSVGNTKLGLWEGGQWGYLPNDDSNQFVLKDGATILAYINWFNGAQLSGSAEFVLVKGFAYQQSPYGSESWYIHQRPPVCGDGRLWSTEECDDGNLVDGDGCSAACLLGGPTTTSTTTTTTTTTSTTTTTLPAPTCGDPTEDGQITAADALLTLQAAVGLTVCDVSRCDTNADGQVTALDALKLLQYAVGLDVTLNCGVALVYPGATSTTSTTSTTLP